MNALRSAQSSQALSNGLFGGGRGSDLLGNTPLPPGMQGTPLPVGAQDSRMSGQQHSQQPSHHSSQPPSHQQHQEDQQTPEMPRLPQQQQQPHTHQQPQHHQSHAQRQNQQERRTEPLPRGPAFLQESPGTADCVSAPPAPPPQPALQPLPAALQQPQAQLQAQHQQPHHLRARPSQHSEQDAPVAAQQQAPVDGTSARCAGEPASVALMQLGAAAFEAVQATLLRQQDTFTQQLYGLHCAVRRQAQQVATCRHPRAYAAALQQAHPPPPPRPPCAPHPTWARAQATLGACPRVRVWRQIYWQNPEPGQAWRRHLTSPASGSVL